MNKELTDALSPCEKGHCGLVEITDFGNTIITRVYWCRFCGKLEVYEENMEGNKSLTVNLTPKVYQIVKNYVFKK